MKMKTFFLIILWGAFAFSLGAQNTKSSTQETNMDSRNSGQDRSAVLLQLNNGESVLVTRKSGKEIDVSSSNQAKNRKSFDCPDIFALPESKPEPVVEASTPPIETKIEIKQPVKEPFFLPDPVFFRINKSVIDPSEWGKIELAVNYLNEHPGSTVVVTGYADKKTGNTKINLRLSEERSNAVAKALQEKYGININRISINWKGDGLQPFEFDNDKNRAVLFLINP